MYRGQKVKLKLNRPGIRLLVKLLQGFALPFAFSHDKHPGEVMGRMKNSAESFLPRGRTSSFSIKEGPDAPVESFETMGWVEFHPTGLIAIQFSHYPPDHPLS